MRVSLLSIAARRIHPERVEGWCGGGSPIRSLLLFDNSTNNSKLPAISASFFARVHPLIWRSATIVRQAHY